MKHSVFDNEIKRMAIQLSRLKGSVINTTEELGIDSFRLWCKDTQFNDGKSMTDVASLSEEQMEIRRLRNTLKNAELERDILKKAVGFFSK